MCRRFFFAGGLLASLVFLTTGCGEDPPQKINSPPEQGDATQQEFDRNADEIQKQEDQKAGTI